MCESILMTEQQQVNLIIEKCSEYFQISTDRISNHSGMRYTRKEVIGVYSLLQVLLEKGISLRKISEYIKKDPSLVFRMRERLEKMKEVKRYSRMFANYIIINT